MRRLLAAIFAQILLVGVSVGPLPVASGQSPDLIGDDAPRLVVLETWMRDVCGVCSSTGPAVNRLATEYAESPCCFWSTTWTTRAATGYGDGPKRARLRADASR